MMSLTPGRAAPDRRVAALTAACILVAITPAAGQIIKGKTPGEMKQVVSNALATNRRIGGLRPRIEKQKVVFDVTLVPNPDKTEWLALLNLTPQQFGQAKARYAGDGFAVAVEASITANGDLFHSAVWMRTSAPVSTLVLPGGRMPETGKVEEKLKPIDKLLRAELNTMNATGAALAIAKDGKIVYERAFGWANTTEGTPLEPDTPMRIADVSKTMTAVATMKLVESGKLKLDDPVVPILKKVRLRGSNAISDPRWNSITVRNLLQHTGGFDPATFGDIVFSSARVAQELRLRTLAKQKDLVRYKLQRPIQSDPGKQFRYSNFGYCLLGRVIEIVANEPYGSYVQKQILDKAKMTRTKRGRTRISARPKFEAWYHMQREQTGAAFWSASQAKVRRAGKTVDPPDIVRKPDGVFNLEITDAASGWTSTAGDLVRFVLAIDSGSSPLLRPETRETMWAVPAQKQNESQWYGCGWWVTQEGSSQRMWHGGGFAGSSALLVRQDNGIAWAILFNTDLSKSGKPLASEIEPKLRTAIANTKW